MIPTEEVRVYGIERLSKIGTMLLIKSCKEPADFERITKDEFETKEQFQQRINNAWKKPIIGNMTGMDKFAFIQEYSEKTVKGNNFE